MILYFISIMLILIRFQNLVFRFYNQLINIFILDLIHRQNENEFMLLVNQAHYLDWITIKVK